GRPPHDGGDHGGNSSESPGCSHCSSPCSLCCACPSAIDCRDVTPGSGKSGPNRNARACPAVPPADVVGGATCPGLGVCVVAEYLDHVGIDASPWEGSVPPSREPVNPAVER